MRKKYFALFAHYCAFFKWFGDDRPLAGGMGEYRRVERIKRIGNYQFAFFFVTCLSTAYPKCFVFAFYMANI